MFGVALLWMAPAFGAVPVRLPPTERSADWVPALTLADLQWGTSGSPILVEPSGDRWVVKILHKGAVIRSATVARPLTSNAREDLAWLMVSLYSSIEAYGPTASAVVEAPPPRGEVMTPAPKVTGPTDPTANIGKGARGGGTPSRDEGTKEPDPPAVAAAEPPAPEPVGVAEPPPEPTEPPIDPAELALDDFAVDAGPDPVREVTPGTISTGGFRDRPARVRRPPPDPDHIQPWFRLAGGGALQRDVPLRPIGTFSGGAALGPWALGLRVGYGGRTDVPVVDEGQKWSSTELGLEGWAGSSALRLGVAAAVDRRRFLDAEGVVTRGYMPFVRGELALGPRIAHHISAEISLWAKLDLGITDLRVNGADVGELTGTSYGLSGAIRWR
jgi:hypothetical protein